MCVCVCVCVCCIKIRSLKKDLVHKTIYIST